MVPALQIYDVEQASGLARRYRVSESWHLYGYERDEMLLGVIGIEPRSDREGEIRHIATVVESRLRGVGRRMIDLAAERHGLVEAEAETHVGAVEFYEACGFDVVSLEELYTGTEQFRCVRGGE
jgi:ribosomal protein S18 acetylase RimI-like enzyme